MMPPSQKGTIWATTQAENFSWPAAVQGGIAAQNGSSSGVAEPEERLVVLPHFQGPGIRPSCQHSWLVRRKRTQRSCRVAGSTSPTGTGNPCSYAEYWSGDTQGTHGSGATFPPYRPKGKAAPRQATAPKDWLL